MAPSRPGERPSPHIVSRTLTVSSPRRRVILINLCQEPAHASSTAGIRRHGSRGERRLQLAAATRSYSTTARGDGCATAQVPTHLSTRIRPHAFVHTHPSPGEGAHARRKGSRGRVADGIVSPPRRVQVMPSWADRPGEQEARSAPSRNLICRNQQQTLLGRSCCHHSCPLVAATVEWQNATTGAH